ncbi:MAG: HAD-IA family hydrolase [Euryarchaeota archaeon]|nr:HAD-IA family hydrolase [Euryarchaeota archaeon]
MYEAFLFDMDGTLIRMKLDFAKMKRYIDDIVGKREGSLLEAIALVNDEDLQKRALSYVNEQERRAAENSEIMDGARDCLEYLKGKNRKIGIITRNNRESTRLSLRKAEIMDYFDIILSRDDVEKVKPNSMHVEIALKELKVRPEDAVIIGDHPFEIEAGNTMGTLTVGLLSGSGTRERLKNADLLFDSIQTFYEDWVRWKIK